MFVVPAWQVRCGAASSVGDFAGGDGDVGGGDSAAAEVVVVSGARAGERENGGGGCLGGVG